MGAPNHDTEDYCSAVTGVGTGSTPPLMESTFTTSSTADISTAAVGTTTRADISNMVGVAVNGRASDSLTQCVMIVYPYTLASPSTSSVS